MKDIEINGIKETIVERSDYPIEECKNILGNEVTAILGYGPQGRGQGLNMRDQGFKVVLGLRKGRSWDKALADGWLEGETLFETEEAAQRGTILQYLLSDAGQIAAWPVVKASLNELFTWFRNRLSPGYEHYTTRKCGCNPGSSKGKRSDSPHTFSRRTRNKCFFCNSSGLYRTCARKMYFHSIRDWFRTPF